MPQLSQQAPVAIKDKSEIKQGVHRGRNNDPEILKLSLGFRDLKYARITALCAVQTDQLEVAD